MELRRQQIAEKKAEGEKARQAEEERKAKLEAEKRRREKEEDVSKKPPVKPPTTTKKVSRDVSSSFRSHYERFNLRLRRMLRRSERWMVTVLLLNRSHHSRRNLPISNKLNPSRSSRPMSLQRKPPLHHPRDPYPPLLPHQIPPKPNSPRHP